MSATRLSLRREIGRLTGDMLLGIATANGTTVTFKDALRFARGADTLVGRIGWVSAGTADNLAHMVRVTASSKTTFIVNFDDTPLPANTATADEIEFWNERGQGYYPDDVNSEINDAITMVGERATTPATDEATTFDYTTPYITIPATWISLGAVYYQDTNGLWREIPATSAHMEIDGVNRKIRLKGDARANADTYLIRLVGDTAATALTADSDTTTVNAEWLTSYVAYRLMIGGWRRKSTGDTEFDTRLAFVKTQAERTEPKARRRPQGIARRLG